MSDDNSITGHLVWPNFNWNVEATLKQLVPFSRYHFLAAKNAVDTVYTIESTHDRTTITGQGIDLYLTQVTSALICSVAALESTVNEYLVLNRERLLRILIDKRSPIFTRYSRLPKKNNVEKVLKNTSNALTKFNVLSCLLTGNLLVEDSLFKKIDFIIRVRNAFMHFSPEWDGDSLNHAALEHEYTTTYSSDFNLNPYFHDDDIFIPFRCLSADFAIWTFNKITEFNAYYFSNILRP